MDISKNTTTIRPYSIGLIIAVLLLLATAAISFIQVKNLQKFANLVNHSMMVDKEINSMFSNYSMLKSSQLDYVVSKNDISLFLLKNYKKKSDDALQRLKQLTLNDPQQQQNIERMIVLKTDFIGQLDDVIKTRQDSSSTNSNLSLSMVKVTELMEQIRVLKDDMISSEEITLKRNKNKYHTSTSITPFTIAGIALVSILIFGIAFWKIIKNKREMFKTKSFLDNLLRSTDNIICHYKPIRDSNNTIIDFTVAYSNDPITRATGELPEDIIGKRISQLYPFLFENGFFEMLKDCTENDKVLQIEREYDLLGTKKTFRTSAMKFDDGVTFTSVDLTTLNLAIKSLKESNQHLAQRNSILNNAEVMAKLGSYRLDVDNGLALISVNYCRLLGLETYDNELSYDRYKTFVHPDDVEVFGTLTKKIMETGEESDQTYRIISKDGIERTLKSIRHYIKEDGQNILSGVVQNISQEVQQKSHLEDQNLELKRRNEELDSFNHVVSHDLQEPLRKIQMFISLIDDNSNMHVENIAYFKKIEKAAHRMQTLIIHLLTYSRIGKSDQDFKLVDLNTVFEKVKEEQGDLIEEKQVKLSIKQMPTVRAISFQMEQLFNNLISNALKYSKSDELSKIVITSEVVNRNQIKEEFRKKHKTYHKISVIDNGTGFNQEHSKRIFELFQRLHQSNKYNGTGLGLAICKKIMQNHSGHITAIGEENQGATFIVYLPVK